MSGSPGSPDQWDWTPGSTVRVRVFQSTTRTTTTSNSNNSTPVQTPAWQAPQQPFQVQQSQQYPAIMPASAPQYGQQTFASPNQMQQSVQQTMQRSMQQMDNMVQQASQQPSAGSVHWQQASWSSRSTPPTAAPSYNQPAAPQYQRSTPQQISWTQSIQSPTQSAYDAEAREERRRWEEETRKREGAEAERRRQDQEQRAFEREQDRVRFEEDSRKREVAEAQRQQHAQQQREFEREQDRLRFEQRDAMTRQLHEESIAALQQQFASTSQANNARQEALLQQLQQQQASLAAMHEQSTHQSRAREQEKERENAELKRELEKLRRQQDEASQRHERQLVEAAQRPSAVFDMEAMKKVLLDHAKKQPSRDDIQALIQSSMSEQLAGVARSADLVSAAEKMQKYVGKIPENSSAKDIQRMVEEGLDKTIHKLMAKYATAQAASEQRQLEEAQPPQPMPWERQQVQYEIEEMEEPVAASASRRGAKQSASAAPPRTSIAPTAGNCIVRTGAKHSVAPSVEGSLVRTKKSTAPKASVAATPENAMVRPKKLSEPKASVAPTSDNAMVRTKKSTAPEPSVVAASENRSKQSGQAPVETSDPASQPPQYYMPVDPRQYAQPQPTIPSSSRSKASVASSADNAMVPVQHPGKAKASAASAPDNATVRAHSASSSGKSVAAPGEPSSGSSKAPKASVAPSDENAVVRVSKRQ